ncbi:P-type DNA transfer protein VirB5 [Methylobacterium iners]|uniref:Type IV secretion system protein virB5 n=1 Tax=Methylobacterium iners TaxID=418707 RepID=A0ABQ4RVQ4_9HYPH|nr:P-type DNA transfer protein VirB5 [Methylobacterium iners]GJD94465.1 Type IV secretion system protein virB5 [Methylobacterium iners]
MRRFARLTASLALVLVTVPATAFDIVYDPTAVAKLVDQVQQMEKQLTALNDQLTQAKRLYDSFNKLTNAGDVAGLLNSTQFRKYLPAEFSQIESLVNGSGSGTFASSLDSYLTQNRVYTANPGNAFYATELDRIARQTGTSHSIGQAVYDTAAKRVDELDKLRQQIGQARDVKDVLDLSARVQVESTLLQNDVLRMQGLAMVQRAQGEMNGQRERERGRQLIDEMKAAVR